VAIKHATTGCEAQLAFGRRLSGVIFFAEEGYGRMPVGEFSERSAEGKAGGIFRGGNFSRGMYGENVRGELCWVGVVIPMQVTSLYVQQL